jgi:hypothetical protein
LLSDGFEAIGAGENGTVIMPSARVGGDARFGGGKIHNESGPALYADGLQVDRNLSLTDGFEAIGARENGTVIMPSARVGGDARFDGGKIHNESGPALHAEGLQVDRDLLLRDGFEATGAGDLAVVVLSQAQVGGRLDMSGGRILNNSGPALHADSLQVHTDVFLREGFEAVSAGREAAVRLRGVRVGGDFDCSGARIRNESGPGLDAQTLQVGRNAFLHDNFEAIGGTEEAVVNLSQMHVAGMIVIQPWGVYNPSHPHALFSFDGLTYSGTPGGLDSPDGWLALLRHKTPDYAAQPYQQLAKAFGMVGHDRDVRKVLMEQRRHQLRSGAVVGRAGGTWVRFTGLTLGYGYQPWRALIGLFAVVLLSVLLTILSPDGALTQPSGSQSPGGACSTVERIGVGLDTALPLIKTDARARCDVTDTPAGDLLTVAGWALQILAWAFATLFIAGFTGAVRKT